MGSSRLEHQVRAFFHPLSELFLKNESTEEYTRGFEVFDREGKGFIKVGELRYILTHLGETMTDEEVDELLKLASVTPCVFALLILSLYRLRFSSRTVTETSTITPSCAR